jgi:hypothetical protein
MRVRSRHWLPVLGLAIISIGALTMPGLSAAPAPAPAAAAGIFVQFVGHDSRREQEGFVVARTEKGWIGIWQDYTGSAAGHGAIERNRIPKIDFERCMVVACFGGKRTNTDGYIAREINEFKGAVRLRFEASTFQTSGSDGRGGAQDTTPYGVWVIPATDKPITIERGRRGLKDNPITWEEVHTVKPADGT